MADRQLKKLITAAISSPILLLEDPCRKKKKDDIYYKYLFHTRSKFEVTMGPSYTVSSTFENTLFLVTFAL